MTGADKPAARQASLLDRLGWLSWAPLTAALLVLASAQRTAKVIDGPDTVCRGAPLIWNCDSGSFSMHVLVFLEPLLADLAIFAAIAVSATLLFGFLLRGPLRPFFYLIAIFAWSIGGLCALLLIFRVTVDASWLYAPPDYILELGPAEVGPAL
jgi:hypothetical protein